VKRKKNGEIEIIEDRAITAGNKNSIYNDEVDFIGNYEPGANKKIKLPNEGEGLVDLADNPFPEDADSESFVKEDSEEEEGEKKPRVHSESEDDDEDDSEELLREYEKIK
jgi:hypothetical protein